MIRMTKTADYGIVLLARMAVQADSIFTAVELANDTGLPHPTVSKVLKIMTRGGLLESYRGAKGGYGLARAPEEIPIIEVITALDGPIGITECIDDTPGECGQESFCRVKGNWETINQAIRDALAAVTLAEMVPAPPELVRLGDGAVGSDGVLDRGVGAAARPN